MPQTGVSATASVGSPDIRIVVNVAVSGVQAGAALGDPDIIIDVTIPSAGFELTTSVGQVRLYSQLDFYAIHVQGGVPLDPYSPLVIDAPIEDVYTEEQLDNIPEFEGGTILDAA